MTDLWALDCPINNRCVSPISLEFSLNVYFFSNKLLRHWSGKCRYIVFHVHILQCHYCVRYLLFLYFVQTGATVDRMLSTLVHARLLESKYGATEYDKTLFI